MRTVLREAEGYYEEKRSRFISNVFRVETEEEVSARLQEIKKRHYEARHHCFAYVLGQDRMKKRSSDDGEPQKTAGVPILNVLEGEEVTDCLIIVTRYFGGTLLGTGGLTRAYAKAAKDGLQNAVLSDVFEALRCQIRVSYEDHNRIRRYADEKALVPVLAEYGEMVTLSVLIPSASSEEGGENAFVRTIEDLTQKRALLTMTGAARCLLHEGKAILI